MTLVDTHGRRFGTESVTWPHLTVEVTPPPGSRCGALTRSERLTPYGIELLRDDALRLAPGTTIDVQLRDADADELLRVRASLAPLVRRGIVIAVRAAASGQHEHAA